VYRQHQQHHSSIWCLAGGSIPRFCSWQQEHAEPTTRASSRRRWQGRTNLLCLAGSCQRGVTGRTLLAHLVWPFRRPSNTAPTAVLSAAVLRRAVPCCAVRTHASPNFGPFPFPKDMFLKFVRENNGYFPVKIQALQDGTCVHKHTPVYQVSRC
jgi:hypothetical protein